LPEKSFITFTILREGMNVNLSLLTVQPLIELVSFTIAVVGLKLEKQEMFLSLSVD